MSSAYDFDQRVILITGATGGIGQALSLALAAEGAQLVLCARREAPLGKLYDRIAQLGPEPAMAPTELAALTPDAAAQLVRQIEESFGRLDGLCHCAATLPALTPLRNLSPAAWYESLQVNLNAAFVLTQACLGLLQASPDAAVLFSTDGIARQGRAYYGPYAVAKAGLEALMRVLAHELEANTPVRVNAVDPGPVRSALRTRISAEAPTRFAPPESVLPAYLYLLSGAARGVTGGSWVASEPGPWAPA